MIRTGSPILLKFIVEIYFENSHCVVRRPDTRSPRAVLHKDNCVFSLGNVSICLKNENIYDKNRCAKLLPFCFQNPLKLKYVHIEFQKYFLAVVPGPLKMGGGKRGWEGGERGMLPPVRGSEALAFWALAYVVTLSNNGIARYSLFS